MSGFKVIPINYYELDHIFYFSKHKTDFYVLIWEKLSMMEVS